MAKLVNDYDENYNSAYYKLIDHIDISAHYWIPIGSGSKYGSSVQSNSNLFYGHFDGDNYTIYGMKIVQLDGVNFYGLFGSITGEVKNVNIEKAEIHIDSVEEGLNYSNGMGSTVGVGALGSGTYDETLKDCYAVAQINSQSQKSIQAGGFVGEMGIIHDYVEMSNLFCESTVNKQENGKTKTYCDFTESILWTDNAPTKICNCGYIVDNDIKMCADIELTTDKTGKMFAFETDMTYSMDTENTSDLFEKKLKFGNDKWLMREKTYPILYIQRPFLEVSSEDVVLSQGRKIKLKIKAHNIENSEIVWRSSDLDVVTVDATGVLTAVKSGVATVTVEKGEYTATSTVTVTDSKPIENITQYNGIDYSAVYNAQYYYENNPDVAVKLGDNPNQLIWHFVNYGMAEGRCAKKDFNVVKYAYCLLNDDLRAAFGGDMKQYYYHYMNDGQYECRSTSDWDSIFDAAYYLQENPDVYKAYSTLYTDGSVSTDFKAIAVQYLQYGNPEGRLINAKLNMNNLPAIRPDVVQELGINNLSGWVNWYINYGQAEC